MPSRLGHPRAGQGDTSGDDSSDPCDCECDEDEPLVSGLDPDKLYLFVTSSSWTGDLGGLEGADAKCATAAASVGFPGTWIAWLSGWDDSGGVAVDAIDRITSDGPWYNIKGSGDPVFNNRANLMTTPLRSIQYTEQGREYPSPYWTGSLAGGTYGRTCDGWSSSSYSDDGTFGLPNATGSSEWTSSGADSCDTENKLLCIQP